MNTPNACTLSIVGTLAAALLFSAGKLSATYTIQDDLVVEGDGSVEKSLEVDGNDGVVFRGEFGQGSKPIPDFVHPDPNYDEWGPRLMWYPAKGAFRVGQATNLYEDAWNDSNIGNYSVAFGSDNYGIASHSFVIGQENFVSSGATNGFASGFATHVSGANAMASGEMTSATGSNSAAFGDWTSATGNAAVTFGKNTSASATNAFALGEDTSATGNMSVAMGFGTTAQGYGQLVIGRYNEIQGWPHWWEDNDNAFIIGNGASSSDRSNAFSVKKNGDTDIGGNLEVAGTVRVEPSGDIGMGQFTSEP